MPIWELTWTGIGNIRTLRPSIFPLEMPHYLWRLCPNLPQCSWPSSLDHGFLRTSIAYLVDRCDTHRRCSFPLEILRGHHLPWHPPSLQAHFCVSFRWQTSVWMPVPVAKHFIVKYSSIHPSRCPCQAQPSTAKRAPLSLDASQSRTGQNLVEQTCIDTHVKSICTSIPDPIYRCVWYPGLLW